MTQWYFYTDHSALHRTLAQREPIAAMRAMQNTMHNDEAAWLASKLEALFYLAYSANSYALDAPLP